MIGKIVAAGSIPAGYTLKTKGIKESVYQGILLTVAGLEGGQAINITSEELEAKMAKTLPKFFKHNLRKKLVEKFGKGVAEMVLMESEGGKKVIFQIQKVAAVPAPTPAK